MSYSQKIFFWAGRLAEQPTTSGARVLLRSATPWIVAPSTARLLDRAHWLLHVAA